MSFRCRVFVCSLLFIACGDDAAPDSGSDATGGVDGGLDAATPDASAPDASREDSGAVDAGADALDASDPTPVALAPAAGSELLYSAAMKIMASPGTARVTVSETGSGSSCDALAPHFECLLDLSASSFGALTISMVALAEDGGELGRGSVAVTRRTIEEPCTGTGSELNACIVARAEAGDAAGFAGVSYINADDAHARVNTGEMTGIDARTLTEPPVEVPDGVSLGIMNESTAWLPAGGRCSLLRCYPTARRARALLHYEEGVLFMYPEHRDVGIRDYYQWQAPFYLMSQGSSSSERDEVSKGLRALAIMTSSARMAADDAGLIGPTLSFLLMRSRQSSDVAYLTPAAHPSAVPNSDNEVEILSMAAAIRADELPPVAKITVEFESPDEWNMRRVLDTVYAVGYAPATLPAETPSGRFTYTVDLSTSEEVSGRDVFFFPAVLRGEAEITRIDDTHYTVSGAHPEDVQLMTGGQERTLSRTTVAFFPHNGVWLGQPAMISVGARTSEEPAPDSNNLD